MEIPSSDTGRERSEAPKAKTPWWWSEPGKARGLRVHPWLWVLACAGVVALFVRPQYLPHWRYLGAANWNEVGTWGSLGYLLGYVLGMYSFVWWCGLIGHYVMWRLSRKENGVAFLGMLVAVVVAGFIVAAGVAEKAAGKEERVRQLKVALDEYWRHLPIVSPLPSPEARYQMLRPLAGLDPRQSSLRQPLASIPVESVPTLIHFALEFERRGLELPWHLRRILDEARQYGVVPAPGPAADLGPPLQRNQSRPRAGTSRDRAGQGVSSP